MSGACLASHEQTGQIFIVGGVGKGAILQAVPTTLVYDIKTTSWSRTSPMNKVKLLLPLNDKNYFDLY